MTTLRKQCRVYLCGGLGNQLFQYAFGRRLALESGSELVLDVNTLFKIDKRYQRSFQLSVFRSPHDVRIERCSPLLLPLRRKLYMKLQAGQPLNQQRYVRESSERPIHFQQRYLDWRPRGDVDVLGYWQCPRYFDSIREQLRQELTYVNAPFPGYDALRKAIGESVSVGIHVRRVDYWSKLDMAYYQQAMARIREREPNARFYVFSDATDWWRDNAEPDPSVTLVQHPDAHGIDDFRLLSECRHFIIANSSFSWWAAWLGNAPDKQVISPGPEIWFNNHDVIPETWESISVERDSSSMREGLTSWNWVPMDVI
jgi:hypothetical protein